MYGRPVQLAWTFQAANEKYASDYPASVGSHMTNTDSAPFQDLVAAISLRENERGGPHWGGLGPELAPADRPVRHLQRQGLPARPQRGANHPGGPRRPRGGDDQVAVCRPRFPWPFKIRTIATMVFQFRVVAGTPNSLSSWPR